MQYILLLTLLLPFSVTAQSLSNWVIGSGGSSSSAASTQLEWTLGETFVSSTTTRQGMLTEGFHQPILEVRMIQEQDFTSETDIQVYPNPTSSELFVNLNQISAQEQYYWLFNMEGQIVDKGNLGTGQTQTIDLERMVPGTYLLKIGQNEVMDHQSIVHHFQIIKH